MAARARILVADDEAHVREFITLLLEARNYAVESVTGGQEAMDLIKASAFDLVISDLMMPEVDGLQVLAQLKACQPLAELVLMTGHASIDSAIKALQQGAANYLTKPFEAEDLLHSVERALSYRRLQLERAALLADLQQRNDDLTQLVEAGQRIATVLETQEVSFAVLDATLNLLQAVDLAALYYKTNAAAEFSIWGLTRSGERLQGTLPLDLAVIREALSQHQTIYRPDLGSGHSLMIEPLTSAAGFQAALAVTAKLPAAFTDNHRQLLSMLGNYAGIALQNARLYAEARRVDELEALYDTAKALNQTLDLQSTLTTLMSISRSLTRASLSSVYLFGAQFDPPRIESVVTLQDELTLTDAERRRAAEIAGQVLTQRRACLIIEPGAAQPGDTAASPATVQSWLAVPLFAGDRLVAVLELGGDQANTFSPDDLRLMQIIASQAGTAIENARLFEEAQHRQAEILRGHRTLQGLFDSITDGLYLLDKNQRLVMINQAEARRLGQSPETLHGRVCDSALWGEAVHEISRVVFETFQTGSEGNWLSQHEAAPRGPFTDRDVRTYPIFAADGQVAQVIIFAQDVSEKRQLQASLFRSANLAAVGQLASSIAHQINNPLTVIIANSQLMEMDAEPNSADYPIFRYIVEAGLQIRQIVQNLLDFSTQDRYEWFETDVAETIDDALKLVAHSLTKSRVEVVTQLDSLPLVIASASHLKLLWMNLLLNARDAIVARNGAGSGLIQLRGRCPDPDHIEIQIVDNGQGIALEHRDHLFHPFFTTKPTEKHLGLGLYTCRSIIDSHHGRIQIDPAAEPGCGTTVTVKLPVERDLLL
jgi:two-component system NtrC family sensor kinase